MSIKIKFFAVLLDKLEYFGANRLLRELYRHSFFGECYYRFLTFLSDGKFLKQILDYQMILDIENPGLEKDLFLHGIRERESTKVLSDYLEEGMAIVDIGANIGYYTLIEASNAGDKGQVTAIEPTPSSFQRLKKNCLLNGFQNVELLSKAVGSDKRCVNIKEKTAHNLNRIQEKGEISVEQDSLDNLIDFDPDIVRMDVEGYELEILKGMEKTLNSEGLILFLEVHPSKIESNYDGSKEEFWRILSENGFQVKYLIRHPPRPKPLYFLKWDYPPKKVLQPDMSVEKTRKEYTDFFAWETVFRVFLEKK